VPDKSRVEVDVALALQDRNGKGNKGGSITTPKEEKEGLKGNERDKRSTQRRATDVG